ncbi:hypothetical protein BC629DRAFT_718620 [Irpex lacteus]|nr:hypothetical protein BC629DRAFT_718620 [Irpex lacteus]
MHRTCPKSCSVLEQRPCKEMSMMLLHRNIIESTVTTLFQSLEQCTYASFISELYSALQRHLSQHTSRDGSSPRIGLDKAS